MPTFKKNPNPIMKKQAYGIAKSPFVMKGWSPFTQKRAKHSDRSGIDLGVAKKANVTKIKSRIRKPLYPKYFKTFLDLMRGN